MKKELYKLSESEILEYQTTPEYIRDLLVDPELADEIQDLFDMYTFGKIQHICSKTQGLDLDHWSIDQIRPEQLATEHPWPGAKFMSTGDPPWIDPEDLKVAIPGPLWFDLWIAATQVNSRLSQLDQLRSDHNFIEDIHEYTADCLMASYGS